MFPGETSGHRRLYLHYRRNKKCDVTKQAGYAVGQSVECCRSDIFLKAKLYVSIDLVPSRKTKREFSVGFWIFPENKTVRLRYFDQQEIFTNEEHFSVSVPLRCWLRSGVGPRARHASAAPSGRVKWRKPISLCCTVCDM